jgi:hypothetical protein
MGRFGTLNKKATRRPIFCKKHAHHTETIRTAGLDNSILAYRYTHNNHLIHR